jgi:hypothetical protein
MKRFAQLAPLAIAAFFLAVALYHGLRTTHDLDWHPGNDAYRDIALAQIILDGDYPADYLFEGEWLWYNPLTGALVAAGAWMGDIAPPQADVRLGPWVNLAVPIAFFVLVWYLADAWVALAALLSFLFFLPQDRPSYVSASYSPWLLAPLLSQALFYATLLSWIAHLRSASWRSALIAGTLLGLTFLGHTAPAVLLGCIMLVTTALAAQREFRHGDRAVAAARARRLGLALTVAFIVSLPFTISILFRYHLHVVNPKPTEWVWEGAALDNLPQIIVGLLSLKSAMMIFGLGAFLRGGAPRVIKETVVAWLTVALGFLGYSFAAQWCARRGLTLPQINPGYHYVLYVIAAGHFLFGLGLVTLVATALARLGRKVPMLAQHDTLARILGVSILLGLLLAANYRDFRVWHGFTRDHSVALRRLEQLDDFAPYGWIADNVTRGSVFLCNDRPGLYCVAPAGGRVVANDPYFSSLYVPYAPRAEARDALWKALQTGDKETFERVAREYHVRYVLAEGEQRDWVAMSGFAGLESVFESKQFTIYRFSGS